MNDLAMSVGVFLFAIGCVMLSIASQTHTERRDAGALLAATGSLLAILGALFLGAATLT